MKEFREGIINFICRAATGTGSRGRLLAPLFGFAFSGIVFLLVFAAFYLDRLLEFPEFMAKPFRMSTHSIRFLPLRVTLLRIRNSSGLLMTVPTRKTRSGIQGGILMAGAIIRDENEYQQKRIGTAGFLPPMYPAFLNCQALPNYRAFPARRCSRNLPH